MTEKRVLLVEDEASVGAGLQYGLTKEGFSVEWAQTGQAGLETARSWNPHLIVLDLRLPDISGFDVCRQLRQEGRRQPVLMLTASDDQVDKVLGLELGADDYLVKPYHLRELVARLRAMLRRAYGELAGAPSGRSVHFGDVEIDLERLQVWRGGRFVDLTATELRLLLQLANNPRRPLSREALIEAVWGYSAEIFADRTVDVHICHLRNKLEPDPAEPCYLVTVRGFGYKFEPD